MSSSAQLSPINVYWPIQRKCFVRSIMQQELSKYHRKTYDSNLTYPFLWLFTLYFSHIYVFCVIATNKTFHQQHSAANCLQKSQFSLSPPANASILAALLVYFSISSTKPKMWHFECHPQLTASFCFNQFRIWQTQFGINSNITVFLKFNLTNWSVCGIHLHKYNRLSILWAVYCSRVNCQH